MSLADEAWDDYGYEDGDLNDSDDDLEEDDGGVPLPEETDIQPTLNFDETAGPEEMPDGEARKIEMSPGGLYLIKEGEADFEVCRCSEPSTWCRKHKIISPPTQPLGQWVGVPKTGIRAGQLIEPAQTKKSDFKTVKVNPTSWLGKAVQTRNRQK
jgi:hypothetical protein